MHVFHKKLVLKDLVTLSTRLTTSFLSSPSQPAADESKEGCEETNHPSDAPPIVEITTPQQHHPPPNTDTPSIVAPIAVIDANWLAYRLSSTSKLSPEVIISKFVALLIKNSFQVCVICDGKSRHHSKRSSLQRSARREHQRILAIKCRLELTQLRTFLNDLPLSDIAQRSKMKTDIKKKETECLKLEKASQQVCGAEFVDSLRELMDDMKTSMDLLPQQLIFIESVDQADPMIVRQSQLHPGSVCFSADSDISILAGDKCLSVKSFKFTPTKDSLTDIEIVSVSRQKMTIVASILDIATDGTNRRYTEAKHPMFNIPSLYVRCLMAVAIG